MVLGAVGGKEVTLVDKLADFSNWIVDISDKYDTVATLTLALFNVVLVFSVFWFTRKMSQSKISIDIDEIPSGLVMFRNKEMKESGKEMIHNRTVFKGIDFYGEGFPRKETHDSSDTIYLRVKNNGELPSIKIRIKLKVKIYKTKMKYKYNQENKLSISSQARKKHSTHNFNIKIPYMGVNEEKIYDLFEFYGQFREVEIILVKIKSNRHSYFREGIIEKIFRPAIIKLYQNPKLHEVTYKNETEKDVKFRNQVYGHKDLWEDRTPRGRSRFYFKLNIRKRWDYILKFLIDKYRK